MFSKAEMFIILFNSGCRIKLLQTSLLIENNFHGFTGAENMQGLDVRDQVVTYDDTFLIGSLKLFNAISRYGFI